MTRLRRHHRGLAALSETQACARAVPHGRPKLRRHHHRFGSRRLRHGHPRRPARLQDGHRRARLSRRHLPQLGLHPHQGAAALGRGLPLPAACQGLRPLGREGRLRCQGGGRALAQGGRAPQHRRRLPDEEEQDRRDLGRGDHRGAGQDRRQGLQERGAEGRARAGQLPGQAHHRRDRSPSARAAGHRARQEAGVDLLRGDGAAGDPEVAAGRSAPAPSASSSPRSSARWARR